jgi:hypothetical protein
LGAVSNYVTGDQKAGDNKENVNSNESAGERLGPEVKNDN